MKKQIKNVQFQLTPAQEKQFDAIKKAQNLSTNNDFLTYVLGLCAEKENAAEVVQNALTNVKTADVIEAFITQTLQSGTGKINQYTANKYLSNIRGKESRANFTSAVIVKIFDTYADKIEKHNAKQAD
jgi:hypothetical protein